MRQLNAYLQWSNSVIHIKTFNRINKFILYTHNLRATQSTHYFFNEYRNRKIVKKKINMHKD